jgi:DNA-binding winged helix-turn-helix (wHTH) protein/TolB-like protein/Flp pilus assembly protein TadD
MNKLTAHRIYEFDEFRIDVDHLMFSHQGREISLVPKAVETLVVLIERRGKIVSKDELLEAVWPDTVVEESNLFLYLSLLRKALGEKDGKPYVETLRRRGYRFNGDAHLVKEEAEDEYPGLVDKSETSGSSTSPQSSRLYVLKDWDCKSTAAPALKAVESTNEVLPAESESVSAESVLGTQVNEGSTQHEVNTDGGPNRSGKKYAFAISLVAILLTTLVGGSFYWRSRKATVVANAADPRTIAILPFRSVVTSDRDDVWEVGMADMLITRLANIRSLKVSPLSSVRGFRNPSEDARKAGSSLGVEVVLDATFTRVGDRIRVNVRLLSVADGTTIWSDTIEEKFTDLLVVQKDIATNIASSLALNLTNDDRTRLQKQYTSNVEAQEYYNIARHNELKITEEGLRQAVLFYQKAVNADPHFALAYAHMADAYRRLSAAGFDPRDDATLQNVRRLAEKSLELDDSLPEALVQVAFAEVNAQNAESKFKKAIELSPYDPEARIGYAFLLSGTGRKDEAIAEAERARELSTSPPDLIIFALESQILLRAGQANEAVLRAKNALAFDPTFWVARYHLGRAYAYQKQYAEAIKEFEKARDLAQGSRVLYVDLAMAYADIGNREKVSEILDERKKRFKDTIHFATLARIYNKLGQKNKALDLLEKAFEAGEKFPPIKENKEWDNLRSEPRFQELLQRIERTAKVTS